MEGVFFFLKIIFINELLLNRLFIETFLQLILLLNEV